MMMLVIVMMMLVMMVMMLAIEAASVVAVLPTSKLGRLFHFKQKGLMEVTSKVIVATDVFLSKTHFIAN